MNYLEIINNFYKINKTYLKIKDYLFNLISIIKNLFSFVKENLNKFKIILIVSLRYINSNFPLKI